MASTDVTATRRAVLGAALVSPIALASLPAAASLPVDCAAWDQAYAKARTARQAFEEAERKCEPIERAYSAGAPSLDMIDFKSPAFSGYEHRLFIAHTLDLDKRWQQVLDGEGRTWWAQDREGYKARAKAGLESVREFRRLHEANDARHDWHAINVRLDALSDTCAEAECALCLIPAPDTEALLWKIEHLFGQDLDRGDSCSSWSDDIMTTLVADCRRLLPTGRA